MQLTEGENRVGRGQGVEAVLEHRFHESSDHVTIEAFGTLRKVAREQVEELRVAPETGVEVGVWLQLIPQPIAIDQPLGEDGVAQQRVARCHVDGGEIGPPTVLEIVFERFLESVEIVRGHRSLSAHRSRRPACVRPAGRRRIGSRAPPADPSRWRSVAGSRWPDSACRRARPYRVPPHR